MKIGQWLSNFPDSRDLFGKGWQVTSAVKIPGSKEVARSH